MESTWFTAKCDTCHRPMKWFAPQLYECRFCGLISSSVPAKNDLYNREYQHKYERYAKTDLSTQIMSVRWSRIGRHLNGHRTLLDYGTADGAFLASEHRDPGLELQGYDVNPYSPYSKPILPPKRGFDVLTAFDVIEHLPSPAAFLDKYYPKLLAVLTPSTGTIRNKQDILSWRHYRPGEHLHYYNWSSLAALFDTAGYNVEEVCYTEGAMRNPQRPMDLILMIGSRR